MKKLGFVQNSNEPYVCKNMKGNAIIYLVLYVNDIKLGMI